MDGNNNGPLVIIMVIIMNFKNALLMKTSSSELTIMKKMKGYVYIITRDHNTQYKGTKSFPFFILANFSFPGHSSLFPWSSLSPQRIAASHSAPSKLPK